MARYAAALRPRGPCRTSPTPVTLRPLRSLSTAVTWNPRLLSAVATRVASPLRSVALSTRTDSDFGFNDGGAALAEAHAAARWASRAAACRATCTQTTATARDS